MLDSSVTPIVAGAVVALVVACLAPTAVGTSWSRSLSTEAVLQASEADGVRIEPSESAGEERVVVFDDAERSGGTLTIDLTPLQGLRLSEYDELHFDLLLDGGVVEPAVTLWGYPDDRSSRRWFFKRFPRVGEWETVRLDLALDDDRSPKHEKQDKRALEIRFSRPAAQPSLSAAAPSAHLRRIRLVRRPVSVKLDPRRASAAATPEGWRFEHPIVLTSHQDEPTSVALRLVDETLTAADATLSASEVVLAPGETREIVATLLLPKTSAMEAGYVERARLEMAVAGTDVVLEPIRGYRPVFLYAVAPPSGVDPVSLVDQASLRPERLAELKAALSDRLEVVNDVVPRYEDHFRCKGCSHRLRAKDLYHYTCVNKDCPQRGKVLTVTKTDPLFASYLSIYHKQNAALTADLARAFVKTNDRRYAEAAKRWLLDYATHLASLPIVSPHSTGFHSRLSSATLFEKESLLPFTEAFLLLRARGVFADEEAVRVADGLLTPLLYDVNLHHYGASAGQVNFILATLKAAAATGRWWFFADALDGDAGVRMLLASGFDADGIGVEGGAYAKSAAERMVVLGAYLKKVGVTADHERIAQIERNSRRIGLLGEQPWEPVVLEDTGFAVLVHGEGKHRRRATINWRRPRERAEHDLLSYDFADVRGLLVNETGRIAYGNQHSDLMLRSAAHNTPVIDGADFPNEPLELRSVGYNEAGAWCVVGTPSSRGGVSVERAILLVRGCLLVVDRIRDSQERRIELPIYGLREGEAMGVAFAPLPASEAPHGPFEKAWQRSRRTVSEATLVWRRDGSPALRMRYVGDPIVVLAGQTVTGWTAERRDLFVLRARSKDLDAACLYEVVSASPRVTEFEAIDGPAGAHEFLIAFDDGRRARVAALFDGPPQIEVSQ